MLSLTTFSLGSTIGLVIIAGLGFSGSLSGNYGDISSSPRRLPIRVSSLHWRLKQVSSEKTRRILAISWTYGRLGFDFLVNIVFMIKEEYEGFMHKYHEVYGPLDYRNLCKVLRIFMVWEPLPYDLIIEESQDALKQAFEGKKEDGLIGVCLRFRTGHIRDRNARSGCARYLHNRRISVSAYLPLEKDGSLRADYIRQKFCIEEAELLIPGRYEIYRASKGDIISPIMLHELTQEFNYVNVVEYEDIYCLQRRRFRQWLLSSKLHYCVRVVRYIAVILVTALSASVAAMRISAFCPGKLWWCISNMIGLALGTTVVALFFEHRHKRIRKLSANIIDTKKVKEKKRVPWHTFPSRFSPYRLTDLGQAYFL